ncbi:MAG: hypothetical protein ACM3N4_01430 [Nitrososphaerota archaeon]
MNSLSDTLGAVAVTTIIVILAGKFVLMLWSWPTLSARMWPWLRMQRWWPVAAERAAEMLLHDQLSVTQYRQLCESGYLDIPSAWYPDRTYRIPRGPGQVLVLEHDRVTERLCVQPAAGGLPEADVVLMHKLLIEADEETYLHTANHFPRSIWR